jgi:hypothetical protein
LLNWSFKGMVQPLKVLKIDTRLFFSLNSDSPYKRSAEIFCYLKHVFACDQPIRRTILYVRRKADKLPMMTVDHCSTCCLFSIRQVTKIQKGDFYVHIAHVNLRRVCFKKTTLTMTYSCFFLKSLCSICYTSSCYNFFSLKDMKKNRHGNRRISLFCLLYQE